MRKCVSMRYGCPEKLYIMLCISNKCITFARFFGFGVLPSVRAGRGRMLRQANKLTN